MPARPLRGCGRTSLARPAGRMRHGAARTLRRVPGCCGERLTAGWAAVRQYSTCSGNCRRGNRRRRVSSSRKHGPRYGTSRVSVTTV